MLVHLGLPRTTALRAAGASNRVMATPFSSLAQLLVRAQLARETEDRRGVLCRDAFVMTPVNPVPLSMGVRRSESNRCAADPYPRWWLRGTVALEDQYRFYHCSSLIKEANELPFHSVHVQRPDLHHGLNSTPQWGLVPQETTSRRS